jgi:hypothetical protein
LPDNQQFEFRPTIPFKVWDQENLLRVSISYKFTACFALPSFQLGKGSAALATIATVINNSATIQPVLNQIDFYPLSKFDHLLGLS